MNPSESPPTRHSRCSGRAGGFTLLEVLAAVAVLGILFTVLATGGIQSLRAQGDNDRRLRAGLIADRAMATIEIDLATGSFPAIGESESEEDEFTVLTEVMAFDAYADEQAELLPPLEVPGGNANGPSDLLQLVIAQAPDLVEMLTTVRVTVEWIEGVNERSVVRSTYALDVASAQEAFGTESPAPVGEEGEDQGLEDDEGDDQQPGPSAEEE